METMDLVRASSVAAVAAWTLVGKDDRLELDWAATKALRHYFNRRIPDSLRVAIGEYEKDGSHGLVFGEELGWGWLAGDSQSDPVQATGELAVDPVEGTRRAAAGKSEAVCVLAYGHGEGVFFTSREHYMMKLAYGPDLAQAGLSVDNDPTDTLKKAADFLGRPPRVAILERPRNEEFIVAAHLRGCRVFLWDDCDFTAAVMTEVPSGGGDQYDLYLGVGGVTEGVLAAAALQCVGGHMQGYLWKDGGRAGETLLTADLVKGQAVVVCTGITNGSLVDGVQSHQGQRCVTDTLLFDGHWGSLSRVVGNLKVQCRDC